MNPLTSCAAAILLYGTDQNLLNSRRLLLQRAGHEVYAVTDMWQIERLAFERSIDVVVFCHTLTANDICQGMAFCRIAWPQIAILRLNPMVEDTSPGWPNILSVKEGPARLVATVQQLLNVRQTRTAGGSAPHVMTNGLIRKSRGSQMMRQREMLRLAWAG